MTPAIFLLALLAQCFMVFGQILLKRAMASTAPGAPPAPRASFAFQFTLAITLMTLYFFLWLSILNRTPLSQLAPFDALGPVLLIAAVHLTLRERLSPRAWLGITFILAGITAIAFS